MTRITPLNSLIQRAVPMVWDESMSYVEFLAAMQAKVNELVAATNTYLSQDLQQYVVDQLNTWESDGTLADLINESVAADIVALKGAGWTDQTVKGNSDAITAVKGSGWTDQTVKGNSDAIRKIRYSVEGLTTAEIQTLINSSHDDIILYFGHVTGNVHTLANTLTLPSNTDIEIEQGVTLRLANGVDKAMFTNSDPVYGNSGIRIRGGKLDMNTVNQTLQKPCIRFDKVTQSRIEQVEIMGTKFVAYVGEGAVHLNDCQMMDIVDMVLHDSGDEGLYIVDSHYINVIRGRFYSCINGSGIATGKTTGKTCTHILIDGCLVYDCTGSGISLNSQYSQVVNCHVYGQKDNNSITAGHIGSPADYSVIKNNIVRDGVEGIRVLGASVHVAVEGNIVKGIDGVASVAIGVSDSSKQCSIIGNHVIDCVIGVHAGVFGDIVQGNTVEGCSSNGIMVPTKQGIVTGNISKNGSVYGLVIMATAVNTIVKDNLLYDDQDTPTQQRGLYCEGLDCIIGDNICYGNTTVQVTIPGATNNNKGNIQSSTVKRMVLIELESTDTTKTVTNVNIAADSRITWMNRTLGAAERKIYVSNIEDGSVTLTCIAGSVTDSILLFID